MSGGLGGIAAKVLGVWPSPPPTATLYTLVGHGHSESLQQTRSTAERLLPIQTSHGVPGTDPEDRAGAACSLSRGPTPTCIKLNGGFGLWDMAMNPSWRAIHLEQGGEVQMHALEGLRHKRSF